MLARPSRRCARRSRRCTGSRRQSERQYPASAAGSAGSRSRERPPPARRRSHSRCRPARGRAPSTAPTIGVRRPTGARRRRWLSSRRRRGRRGPCARQRTRRDPVGWRGRFYARLSMASHQYIFSMYKLSRTHPPDKQVLRDISLSFLPGAKIGVLGLNGAGKSTLLRIMAGEDTEYRGEAQLAPGASVGLLEQEPQLDPDKDVRGNVEDGVRELRDMLDRFNELAANYSDETADEFARLQDRIDAA